MMFISIKQEREREREREMVSRMKRRMVVQRKLKQLRSLTRSKSVRKSSTLMDAFYYINELKLKLEAMIRDYKLIFDKIHLPTEVKAERIGNDFLIKVTSEKGRDVLVSILESFEEMGLTVLQARVSCTHCFCMEAVAEAQDKALEVRNVTEAILKAIGEPNREKNT